MLEHKHMIHIIVMAELFPWAFSPRARSVGIHVFASHRSARRRSVDARIKSGHDELVGMMHHPNESEH